MGIAKKQGSIATVINYVGIVIGYVNVAFLFPLFLDAESLGLRQLLVNFSLLAAQVSLLGFTSVTYRFFPYVKDKEAFKKGFLSFIILIPLGGVLVISLLILLFQGLIKKEFAHEAELFNNYFYLVFPFILTVTLTSVFEGYSKSLFKVIPPTFLKEIVLKLLSTILIISYAFDLVNYDQFWMAYVGTYAFVLIALVLYLIGQKEIKLKLDLSFFKDVPLKAIVAYAAFSLLSGSATTVITSIDGIMISDLIGLEQNGIYTIALFIATLVDVPRRSLIHVLIPVLANAWQQNDMKTVSTTYNKTSLTMLIAGGGVFLLTFLNLDKLYEFIPNSAVYETGFYAVLFIALTKLISMGFGLNVELVAYSKNYKFNLYNNLFLAVICVLTNWYFIPIYGITGAALATCISYTLYNISYCIFIYSRFGMMPFTWRTLAIIGIIGSIFLLNNFFPYVENKYASVLLKSVVITILYGGVILAFKISPDVNDLVFKILRRNR